jgi:hypothetical protein
LKNKLGILGTGCTLGEGAKHDTDCFHDTGFPSKKAFMLLDKTKIKATNKMQLKCNLWPKASKINIVPNLHSTLISAPKMADADYMSNAKYWHYTNNRKMLLDLMSRITMGFGL